MLGNIILYSEFACGVILLLFVVLQLTYRNREFINYNLAGLYFCLSYVILIFWSFKSGVILHLPWMFYTDISMAFAIGPFVYFYIKTVIGLKTDSLFRYMIHFIPAFVSFIAIIIYNITDNSLTDYYIKNNIDYPVYHLSHFIGIIELISSFVMISYIVPATGKLYMLLRDRSHKSLKELKIVFRYLSLVIFFSGMMLLAGIIRNNVLNDIAVYFLTLLAVWYFIFSFRYPDFTQKAIKEARTVRYKSSIINGIDSDTVLRRLDELMEDEKVFADEDITLQKLSGELMITPHQLSNILNSKRKINFRTLINSYRVKEAISLMKQFPDKNILEIALDSGFSSKSSFNSVFLKITGIAPRDYRKNIRL